MQWFCSLPPLSLSLLLLSLLSPSASAHGRHSNKRLAISDSAHSLSHGHHPAETLRVARASYHRAKREISAEHQRLHDLESRFNEERESRKMLRKKKKRLRELRDEIREINRVIVRSGPKGNVTITRGPRRRADKWRKKVLAKMGAIMDRLDRLEKQWIRENGGTTSIPLLAPAVIAATDAAGNTTASATTVRPLKTSGPPSARRSQERHLAAVAQSLNGENGTACNTHKDCRPGRCCHRSPSGDSSLCVFHALSEAALCEDSCQCAAQLHCFARNDNTTEPACKKAASSDILTGFYLNAPSSTFPSPSSTPRRPNPIVVKRRRRTFTLPAE